MTYAADTWLTPITLTASNNVLQIEEDSASCVITVTPNAGTYYLHNDSSLHSTHPGLYYAIKTLIAAGTGSHSDGTTAITGTKTNSYDFEVVDPSSSDGVTNGGLRLKGTHGSLADDFIIDVSDSTMDMRWFGQLTAAPSDPTSSGSGTQHNIDSPGTVLGRWIPYGIDGPAEARDKSDYPYNLTRFSGPDPANSVAVEWSSGRTRMFEYTWLAAANVDPLRASDTGFADLAGLAQNDFNNGFRDVWDHLRRLDECIVVHNDTSDLQVDSHSWEVVKAYDASITDWRSVNRSLRRGGDYRSLNFRVWIDPDYDNYQH